MLGLAVVAAVAIVAFVLTRPDSDSAGTGGAAGAGGPGGKAGTLDTPIPTGAVVGDVLSAGGSIWVTDAGDHGGLLQKIDPVTTSITTIRLSQGQGGGFDLTLAAGGGAVWVADAQHGTIYKVNPASNTVVGTVPIKAGYLTFGDGSLWAGAGEGSLQRIDPGTLRTIATVKVGSQVGHLAFGGGNVWALSTEDDKLTQVDAATNKVVRTYEMGSDPTALAFGADRAWVAENNEGWVRSVDPATGKVEEIQVGGNLNLIAVGEGSLWVGAADSTVTRVDIAGKVSYEPLAVPFGNKSMVVADGTVWVTGNPTGISGRISDGYVTPIKIAP